MKTIVTFVIVVLGGYLLYAGARMARKAPGPRYRAKSVMTDNEKEFFWRLYRALPSYFIFPQVSMGALLEATDVDKKRNFADFGRIAQKRVDYAIYDDRMNLLCICELDDRTHSAARDAIRDGYFTNAGIRTIRWHSRGKPTLAEIRDAIRPRMPLLAPELNNSIDGAIALPDGSMVRALEHGEIIQAGDLYGKRMKVLSVYTQQARDDTGPIAYVENTRMPKFYRRIALGADTPMSSES